MNRQNRRQEFGSRFGVLPQCRGHGLHAGSGLRIEFRGIDVSVHGFGCLVVGLVQNRDILILDLGGSKVPFEVMWAESHLGIENTFRVGLQCLDRTMDVRNKLDVMGLVTVPLDDDFAA